MSSTIQEVVDTSVILLNTFTNIEDDLKISGVLYSDNATMLNMSAFQITSQDVITENTTIRFANIDDATINNMNTNNTNGLQDNTTGYYNCHSYSWFLRLINIALYKPLKSDFSCPNKSFIFLHTKLKF